LGDILPILMFEPLLREVVWGGRALGTLLGKDLPPGALIGESWELVDLPDAQSVVARGELAGATLAGLMAAHAADLLGGASAAAGRFPLLVKLINARDVLSVQVHPDEAASRRLGNGARPKTEAWYVIDREPGAALYAGLAAGVDRELFAAHVAAGTVEALLHRVEVQPGDFVFLPAGAVHAIGKGIVLAEVQTPSDTTFRVFDWNRPGLDGAPRPLHVAEALESIAFDAVGLPAVRRPPSGRDGVACAQFTFEAVPLAPGAVEVVSGAGPLALTQVSGEDAVAIRAPGSTALIGRGRTALVPAVRASRVELESPGPAVVLAARVPA
jgi:mannose-6-phosphate isomerase